MIEFAPSKAGDAHAHDPDHEMEKPDWVGSIATGHANTSVGTYRFTEYDINGVDCFHPNVDGQARIACLAWAKSPDGAGPSAGCFQ